MYWNSLPALIASEVHQITHPGTKDMGEYLHGRLSNPVIWTGRQELIRVLISAEVSSKTGKFPHMHYTEQSTSGHLASRHNRDWACLSAIKMRGGTPELPIATRGSNIRSEEEDN